MIFRIRKSFLAISFIIPTIVLLCSGCVSGPPPSRSTPQKTFRAFARNLLKKKYSRAYEYLSSDTRKRYKLNHFWGMFKETLAGKLLRWKVKNWKISDIERLGENHAYVKLQDPKRPDHYNRYELIREWAGEEEKQHVWRIRFFIADELHIPRRDEELFFGKQKKKQKKSKNKKSSKNGKDTDRTKQDPKRKKNKK